MFIHYCHKENFCFVSHNAAVKSMYEAQNAAVITSCIYMCGIYDIIQPKVQ